MKIQEVLDKAKKKWKYGAMDASGYVFFFSRLPRIDKYGRWVLPRRKGCFVYMSDVFDFDEQPCNWKNSLVIRRFK